MKRSKITPLLTIFAVLSLISIINLYSTHQLPTEENRTISQITYEHIGKYDYTAQLKPNNLYNQSTLKPGEGTLYMAILDHINLTFSYTFNCDNATNTSIKYNIHMELESPNKWPKNFTATEMLNMFKLTNTTNVTVNAKNFSTTLFMNTTQIDRLVSLIDLQETGTHSSTYNLYVKPEIQTVAETNITIINETFTPNLTMKFRKRTPEGDYISMEGLEQANPGTVEQTKKIPLPWVTSQRYASYIFCIATLSVLTATALAFTKAKPERRRKRIKPIEEIIEPYKEIIAEATKEPSYEGETRIIPVKTLEDLVKIADTLSKPVLTTERPPTALDKKMTYIFYVVDGSTKYEYTIITKRRRKATSRPE